MIATGMAMTLFWWGTLALVAGILLQTDRNRKEALQIEK